MPTTDQLERRIRLLERRLADLPSRWKQPPMMPRMIKIGGGNTVPIGSGSTIAGIKWPGTGAPTSVPSAYDPTLSPTCIDGLGWGDLYDDSVWKGKVLVGNWGQTIGGALAVDNWVITLSAVAIPVDASTESVLVYVAEIY